MPGASFAPGAELRAWLLRRGCLRQQRRGLGVSRVQLVRPLQRGDREPGPVLGEVEAPELEPARRVVGLLAHGADELGARRAGLPSALVQRRQDEYGLERERVGAVGALSVGVGATQVAGADRRIGR